MALNGNVSYKRCTNNNFMNSQTMSSDVGNVLRARQLTVVESAARLGLKPSTVRKLILTRRIGFTKIGRAVRIPETEVERIIEAGFQPAIQR